MENSFKTKYNRLVLLYHRLNEFKKFTPQTVKMKTKTKIVYNTALNLYNKLLSIYFNYYNNITNEMTLIKQMIIIIYLLKVIDLLNQRKKMKKKVNYSQKKLLLKE